MAGSEEERPPIIVRGGSLILESGDKQNGKPWKKKGEREFQQEHPNGKDVAIFSVRFVGGGANCKPVLAPSVHVTFALDDGSTVQVTIGREYASESREKREPLVRSTKPLQIDATDPRLLVFKGDGRILRVEAGGQVCTEPVQVIVQPVAAKEGSRFLMWAGGLLGMLAAFALFKRFVAAEEERPPIIVRGGSLVFESGDPRHKRPKKRTGKPWKHEFGWKSKHSRGESISRYGVRFETSNECAVTSTTKATIAYQVEEHGLTRAASFTLAIARDDDNGKYAPVIETSERLVPEIDPSRAQTLTFRPGGHVEYIEFDKGQKCPAPGVVHFDPVP